VFLQIAFFVLGLLYSGSTFFHAAKIYVEAYHTVPKGECRVLIKIMAWCFFTSWIMFPILFLMGPEGFGHLSPYASIIGHTFADLLSKNLWGLFGHTLRVKVGLLAALQKAKCLVLAFTGCAC
jgi:bacteriorhodopsin